jgi:orotate phosphoribosyltransferase-like protein|tara:strand:- start:2106 stop:2459 length:354 start_codon:yes stop_codon:yes gene_type:complete
MWGDKLVGVAIVGRPIARMIDDGLTAEVTRVCVPETAPKNTISYLYGKIWRVWQQMGGKRMVTYTLKEESGSTLKAVGWKMIGETDKVKKGKGWVNRPGREWQKVSDKIKKRWIIEC